MERTISILLTVLVFALGAVCKEQHDRLRAADAGFAPARGPAENAVAQDARPDAETPGTATGILAGAQAQAPPPAPKPLATSIRLKTAADYYHKIVWRLRTRNRLDQGNAARALSRVNKDYADLIKHLQLDPAFADALVRLLQAKRVIRMNLYDELYHANRAAAEREVLIREANRARGDIEDEIAKLLGDEMYPVYKDYDDTLPQRRDLDALKTKLYGAGMDLTWDQENALLLMMKEESRRMIATEEDPVLAEVGTLLPEERDASEQELALRREQVNNQRYLEAAKSILTPEQMEIYEEYLAQGKSESEFWADAFPSREFEAYNRAPVVVGSPDTTIQQAVTMAAATIENELWGDGNAGSEAVVTTTTDNMLALQTDLGSGWGAGITFLPTGPSMNEDLSVNAAGAKTLTARIYAPAGATLRFGLTESGSTYPGSENFAGANGSDGEAFRHDGVTTKEGWQVYTIPLSEMKLNGGWGNQKGNRTIDTQAIRGLEILVPGGQPDVQMKIDWVNVE
ncbi:MAG: hypothetical protein V1929_04790 [bacterium]